MKKAIRDEWGQPASKRVIEDIFAEVTRIRGFLLALPIPGQLRGRRTSKTFSYFELNYPIALEYSVKYSENKQPILMLCSKSWKAKRLLTSSLQAASVGLHRKTKADPQDPSFDVVEEESAAPPAEALELPLPRYVVQIS